MLIYGGGLFCNDSRERIFSIVILVGYAICVYFELFVIIYLLAVFMLSYRFSIEQQCMILNRKCGNTHV